MFSLSYYPRTILLISMLLLLDLSLNAQHQRFEGVVLDSLQQPISEATIRLMPDQQIQITNSKGEFTFQRLYVGDYSYIVTAVGYYAEEGKIRLPHGRRPGAKITLRPQTIALEEAVINARSVRSPTLTEAKNSAMQVTVIDRKAIAQMGSRRLDEVLREQTGMAIVNNTAGGSRSVGVQMQGLSSQYIMVLIDGQPLLGRQSGNLDLSRISVTNIERIEIVKGASSCLYGNDALGGAINIITRMQSDAAQLHTQLSYGSYGILDATIEGESNFNKQQGYAMVSANYYRTKGFNNNKSYMKGGTTIPPYNNVALQGKVRHYLGGPNQALLLTLRQNQRQSTMLRGYSEDYEITDRQQDQDFNGILSFDKKWSSRWKSLSSYYFSRYFSTVRTENSSMQVDLSTDEFTQHLHKLEQQLAYHTQKLNLTAGVVAQQEIMKDLYLGSAQHQHSLSFYAQGNYKPLRALQLMGGMRYDKTVNYGQQWSPSIGLEYALLPTLQLKVGLAAGFKAPDFRTRYQVFYNPGANYYVIGSQVLHATLQQMQEQGSLSEVRQNVVDQLREPLAAEHNQSLQGGLRWQPSPSTTLEVNFFQHRLQDQINSIQVATGHRNMAIYSYQNLPESVNKGFDLSLSTALLPSLHLQAGYQYLVAKDLSIARYIQQGKWPYSQNLHDPNTGASTAVQPTDYWGLENRSRHQFNLALLYTWAPQLLQLSLRGIFRGKYPFADANGNQFIDRYDVFVQDHIIYYAQLEKKFSKIPLALQLGIENINNYTNYLIPGQMGRIWNVGLSYRWIHNK